MSKQTAMKKPPKGGGDFDLSAIDNLSAALSETPAHSGEQVLQWDPSKTRDNPYQPRTERNAGADAELVESARQHGIQQPIIALAADEQGIRTVVFGHRRRDAAAAAGIEVPIIERDYTDEQLQVISLVENLQRENMAAKDEVAAVAALATQVGNKRAAQLLGRKNQYVSKIVKISKSAAPIRELLASGYSTDLAAFYELSLLHTKNEGAAQNIIDRWTEEPDQRVSLRQQVVDAKAKLADDDDGGVPAKAPAKAKVSNKEAPDFPAMVFEPSGVQIKKLAKGRVKVVFELGDDTAAHATFSKALWSDFLNEVNS